MQYVHKINNQLLSTANAKDINTDYYIQIALKLQGIMDLLLRGREGDRNKLKGFEPGQGQM